MRMTPEAREQIARFLEDLDGSRLRVAQLTTGGGCCAKLNLGVTLDETVEEEDEVLVVDGLEVVIDRVLHQSLGDVLIGFDPEAGVTVTASARAACPTASCPAS